jgi:NDP-sugar pyrophosphorylase family protein
MTDSLAGVALAAGAGSRLRPLTLLRPKALCPVANVPLVDHALERLAAVTPAIAVNVHHGRELMESHLSGRVHLSIEPEAPVGTAGALGALRDWLDGRSTVVVNADAWAPAEDGDLRPLLEGWDGERVRLLVPGGGPFGAATPVAGCLLPWRVVRDLSSAPASLYDEVWRPAAVDGVLEVVPAGPAFFDCGTPRSYLAANLTSSGGESVIGPGAVVEGEVVRTVVWPGSVVWAEERLEDAIRAGAGTAAVTVLVR